MVACCSEAGTPSGFLCPFTSLSTAAIVAGWMHSVTQQGQLSRPRKLSKSEQEGCKPCACNSLESVSWRCLSGAE